METPRRVVDVRYVATTTFVAVSVVLLTVGAVYLLERVARVLALLVVALFFAVIFTPPVDLLHHRAGMRRGLATALVFTVGFLALSGLVYAFVKPLVDQSSSFSADVPTLVRDAERGRGPVGRVVKRLNLQKQVRKNRPEIDRQVRQISRRGFSAVKTVVGGIVAAITIMVLTVLLLLSGPRLSTTVLGALPEPHRERVRRVSADASKAVAGYMFGNVVISIIAGVAAYVFLLIAGVPYPQVLALWVAFADLIPLVGATLGAIPTIVFALLHSTSAGIAAIVFFVVYQQFENHVLQVTIMARTVNVNPLGILVSVLIGVELFGLLGALLAIPAAGVIQVVARDIWDRRSARIKDEPTVGVDEVPHQEATAGTQP
ncbi:MAG: AI-2E family transporter [Acidimicrobiales bacterium]